MSCSWCQKHWELAQRSTEAIYISLLWHNPSYKTWRIKRNQPFSLSYKILENLKKQIRYKKRHYSFISQILTNFACSGVSTLVFPWAGSKPLSGVPFKHIICWSRSERDWLFRPQINLCMLTNPECDILVERWLCQLSEMNKKKTFVRKMQSSQEQTTTME